MDRAVRRRTNIRILSETHADGLINLRAEDIQPNTCDMPRRVKGPRICFEPGVESSVCEDTNRRTRRGIGPNDEITHKMGDAIAESSVLLIIRDDNSVAQPMRGQSQ